MVILSVIYTSMASKHSYIYSHRCIYMLFLVHNLYKRQGFFKSVSQDLLGQLLYMNYLPIRCWLMS